MMRVIYFLPDCDGEEIDETSQEISHWSEA